MQRTTARVVLSSTFSSTSTSSSSFLSPVVVVCPAARATFATAVSQGSTSTASTSSSSSPLKSNSKSISRSNKATLPSNPSPTHPRTRSLPIRKQFLYDSHAHLLGSNELVLFLRQTDFTAQEYTALRAQINALKTDPSNSFKLTVLRPGLITALLRDPNVVELIDVGLLSDERHRKGSLSVLTSKTLHPPTLKKVLKIVQTYSNSTSRNEIPVDPNNKAAVAAAVKIERLAVISALAERRAFGKDKVGGLSDLPSLDTLRAQLVGLLSSPGSRIVGVVGARANQVAMTLEGFKLGLQEQQEAK